MLCPSHLPPPPNANCKEQNLNRRTILAFKFLSHNWRLITGLSHLASLYSGILH
jgi:hypothetical protein